MKVALYIEETIYKVLEYYANQNYRQVRSQIIVIIEEHLREKGLIPSNGSMINKTKTNQD